MICIEVKDEKFNLKNINNYNCYRANILDI